MPSSNSAITIRVAQLEDIPALEVLIERSVMTLQADHYTLEQRRGALGTVFGIDRRLRRLEPPQHALRQRRRSR